MRIKKLKAAQVLHEQAISELWGRGVTGVWCHTILLAARHM